MDSNQLTEAIERYVNGEMNDAELTEFNKFCKENPTIEKRVTEHKQFASALNQYRQRVVLEERLNAIHNEMDVHSMVEEMAIHPSWVVQMWRSHHSKISVAASIAIFIMLGAMFFTGYFRNNEPHYAQLSEKIQSVENRQNLLNRKADAIAHELHSPAVPRRHVKGGNYRGSGFALSANGYIVTNYHVIGSRYDSIYVQNAAGDAFRAKMIYAEPQSDIAILKISDASFSGLPTLPYSFKKGKSDLGESVYSMGYPEGDAPVMDMGYISSANGYQGDSVAYRVSIPVNPGNSGSPLLNNKGNVIGIVSGKQTQTEGASYAIKAGYLFKAIQNVPLDSLTSKLSLNNKNTLTGLSRVQQIKKLQNYVFMVKVY